MKGTMIFFCIFLIAKKIAKLVQCNISITIAKKIANLQTHVLGCLQCRPMSPAVGQTLICEMSET